MVIRQAETSTEELVVLVAIVVLVAAETVIAGVVKREQYFTRQVLATDRQQRAHQANGPGLGRSNRQRRMGR
jgi:hypothetical protein